MREIPPVYNPKSTEDKWYKIWQEKGYFHAGYDAKKKPYSIVIPPPNITGILHMGHALNNTIQDILIRRKRMQGYNAEWLPGTDHAGIATQNVVEKMLAKKGIDRHDLGREDFIKQVWKWREEYGSTIISQLKRLGYSCDWDRARFTMDDGLSNAVIEVFVRLYEKGLIYRGNYIINWCPRCRTALSDEEAHHRDLNGYLYYIKYPVKKPNDKTINYIVVATTRPETMLGDVAVAVNPDDSRYKNLIGETLTLPLMNREIKIIADDIVDPEFGTGAVKITPAHDPNDFQAGIRHKLEPILVMNPDGTMNNNAGDYSGMDRFEAREAILEDLKELKILEKIEPHAHSVGHCYRCHTVVEPYLSLQWFVKMKPLAKPGIEAVKTGKVNFYPERWTKVYLDWMENIRDWCISRQIWWGHRIPVFYCKNCQKTEISNSKVKTQNTKLNNGIIVSRTKPDKCPHCGSEDIYQDEDVLDTWFSSWLWPFSTFGWPDKTEDLNYFYPTSSLVTAQEIIFFWVARMIMAGYEFMEEAPFKDIYIHGTVRDDTGAKMSKSLGNIIDPLEIIDEFGADALRFSMISITAAGQDVFLSKEKFQSGRNFANKIWNAARFVITNLSEDVDTDLCVLCKNIDLALADRWIISNLYTTLENLDKALESYKFNEAANILYDFIWHKYCNWYLETAKGRIKEKGVQVILYKVLEKSLRMLHPFMPFITEEIWSLLPHKRDHIMIQPWPHLQNGLIDKKVESEMDLAIGIITAIRNIRAEANISPRKSCKVIISTTDAGIAAVLNSCLEYIKPLAKAEDIQIGDNIKRPKASSTAVFGDCEISVPLEGLIDLENERKRIIGQIADIEKWMRATEARLNNENFIKRAPAELVEAEKVKLSGINISLDKLRGNLKRIEN